MARQCGMPMEMVLREAIHPDAPTRWRRIFWWVLKRVVDIVSYLFFFYTTVPKVWLFLYAGYPGIWLLGVGYIVAKTLELFFEMPLWFEMFDLVAAVVTLPSTIFEAAGILPSEAHFR